MNKANIRIFALLLVPVLLVDTSLAGGLSSVARSGNSSATGLFSAEALIARFATAVWAGRSDNATSHGPIHRLLLKVIRKEEKHGTPLRSDQFVIPSLIPSTADTTRKIFGIAAMPLGLALANNWFQNGYFIQP